MKITNAVTFTGLSIWGLSITMENITAGLGLIAVFVVVAVNIFAFLNKRLERKVNNAEEANQIAEKEVHELKAEILRKQLKKLNDEE